MNLRDLVGRMAIRTDKVREAMPWEMERAFRLDFMVPVPIFDREKYMDEPVRILWVRMKSGKNMPVDMALHNYKKDSTGKEKIVTPDGEVVTGRILVGERGDGAGYISHFASCKKYRR